MRFMMLVKGFENAGPPPKPLLEAIATLSQAETLIESGGLLPSGSGARVRLAGGRLTVTDGPFAEAKEVVGGYAVFELHSKDEAVASAVRFMQLHQQHWPGWQGETEARELCPPPDVTPAADARR
jgi:hypothetical protein